MSHSTPISVVVILVVAALSAAPLPSWASDGAGCREMQPTTPDHTRGRSLGKEALKQYRAGMLRQALDQFEAAYALYPHPRILENMAHIEKDLRDFPSALSKFERLREAACNKAERDRLGRIIEVIKVLMESTTEEVTIVSRPDGVSLWIDTKEGEPNGTTPWRGRLDHGSHFVLLRKVGFRDLQKSFTVEKGKPVPLDLALEPLTPAEVTIVSQPSGASVWIDREDGDRAGVTPWRGRLEVGSHFVLLRKDGYHDKRVSFTVEVGQAVSLQEELEAVGGGELPRSSHPPPPELRRWKRLLGWIAAGVGGVGLLTGGGLTLVALKTDEDAKQLHGDSKADDTITLREIRNKENDARGFQTASFVAYGTGGAFLATGAVLLFLDAMDPPDDAPVALVPTPGGLAFALRF